MCRVKPLWVDGFRVISVIQSLCAQNIPGIHLVASELMRYYSHPLNGVTACCILEIGTSRGPAWNTLVS